MAERLEYRVKCWQGNYWETIAAFNIQSAAIFYAQECAKTNKAFGYRVWKRNQMLFSWIPAKARA